MKSYIGKNLVNYKRVSCVNSFHVSYYVIAQLTTYTSQTHPKLLDWTCEAL